jgi:hypothetical protein
MMNDHISHLSKIQQRGIHKYCKKIGSLLPLVKYGNVFFYFKGDDVTEFITTILALSGLNVFLELKIDFIK